jgi:hypothetical protein
MFGSFLPSLWSSTNHSLLASKEPTLLCNHRRCGIRMRPWLGSRTNAATLWTNRRFGFRSGGRSQGAPRRCQHLREHPSAPSGDGVWSQRASRTDGRVWRLLTRDSLQLMVLLGYLFITRSLLGFRKCKNHAAAFRFVSMRRNNLFETIVVSDSLLGRQ